MDIQEMKSEKREVERPITEPVSDFQERTGLYVPNIREEEVSFDG